MFRLYGPAGLRRLGTVVGGVAAGLLCASVVSAQQAPAPAGAPAQQATPAAQTKTTFEPDGGLVLFFVKTDKTADFEATMNKLAEAFKVTTKPELKQQAQGWKLFKSPQPAGTNTLYVFVIDPALKGADYTIGNILYDTFEKEGEAIETLYIGFRDSLAQGLNLVNLQLMHDFSKDAAAAPAPAAATTTTPPPGQ